MEVHKEMRSNKPLNIFLITLIALMPCVIETRADDLEDQVGKLNQIISLTYKNHLLGLSSRDIVDAAIRGIIKELDPHSYYFTPDMMKAINDKRNGSRIGTGVDYAVINDTMTVISSERYSPAEESGIMTGDKVLKIDAKNVVGADRGIIDQLLDGEKGTTCLLSIKRKGNRDFLTLRIKRSKIPIYSVDAAFMIAGTDIGYISINRFMATTYIEMMDSLSILTDKGMKKLIIDFRGNSGGILEQAYLVADEFISAGYNIVFTKARRSEFNETYKSTDRGQYEKIPLILLIDGSTASAPEIVAGAIQDLDRGVIVGEPSFGKGLVQKPYVLSDGSEIWLTIAKYYTPSGRSIQRSFENKSTYGTMAGRLDLEEGFNFSHNFEIKPDFIGADSIPMYRTKGGRLVAGGGGITPDYIVKNDSVSELTQNIMIDNAYEKFAVKFLSNDIAGFKKDFPDFSKFENNFEVNDVLLNKFKTALRTDSIVWNEDEYNISKELICRNIKSSIAGAVWGNNERKSALVTDSRQLQKAVELMPLAEKLTKLN